MKPLTPKERAFAHAYLEDPNASSAARKAGYGAAHVAGHRALKRPRVVAYIQTLADKARAKVQVKDAKHVKAEVMPVSMHLAAQNAVASRAEVLAMATNVVRLHDAKTVGSLYKLTEGADPTLVADAAAIAALPLSAVRGLSHDAAGDLDLKLADPMVAAKILLDDHNRARSDEDPMARPRVVMNTIVFNGSDKDREDLDKLALRMAQISPDKGGGDGNA